MHLEKVTFAIKLPKLLLADVASALQLVPVALYNVTFLPQKEKNPPALVTS